MPNPMRCQEAHLRRAVHASSAIDRLAATLVTLMGAQSAAGLVMPTEYRDTDWIKAAWFGNDVITLLVVVPLGIATRWAATFGSTRATLLWIGAVGYAVYNYAFYLFGAALNAFLPLYVITLGIAIVTLTSALAHLDPIAVQASFRNLVPSRAIGVYLVSLACGPDDRMDRHLGRICFRGSADAYRSGGLQGRRGRRPAVACSLVGGGRRAAVDAPAVGLRHRAGGRRSSRAVPVGALSKFDRRDRARPRKRARRAADVGDLDGADVGRRSSADQGRLRPRAAERRSVAHAARDALSGPLFRYPPRFGDGAGH